MDILTQGLLGSVTAQSASRKEEALHASAVGFLSGLLADADVLIRSGEDPLLTLDYHRHFTHSIFFIPAGALIASILLFPFFRKKMRFQRLYKYSFLGYLFSGFIDACTSYGTHLFWPFINERTAFHLIAIVDPVFTGILLSAFVYVLVKKQSSAARTALALCALYLSFGFFQMKRAEAAVYDLASRRGQPPERLVAKPTIGNIVLWRSTYISEGRIYVDAVRTGFSSEAYEGSSIPLYVPERDASAIPKDSVLFKDILRFQKFSDGFIGMDPSLPNVLGDIRYSMSPGSTKPLWGITLDPAEPDRHPEYRFYRDFSSEDRKQFMRMVIGSEEVKN